MSAFERLLAIAEETLDLVRALLANPPEHIPAQTNRIFAGPGDESVLAICNGNRAEIVDAWVSRDTIHSVGKFLIHFRRLGLQGFRSSDVYAMT